MVQGSAGGSTVKDRRPERERHHWILRVAGDRKLWLTPFFSFLKVRRVFVSEYQNNPHRMHKNPNHNVVQDNINNTYDAIVPWLHTNQNCNIVQDSMKNTYDTIAL